MIFTEKEFFLCRFYEIPKLLDGFFFRVKHIRIKIFTKIQECKQKVQLIIKTCHIFFEHPVVLSPTCLEKLS